MVLPLLLAGIGGAGAISVLSGGGGSSASNIAGDVVEESFAVMGKGIIKGVSGLLKAIRDESKGHEVEVSALVTVALISIFYFRTYVSPRVGVQ
jgi:hypothetical protein